MLSGIIAYQVLRQENPPIIEKVKAVLEKHPWYANQWQVRLQDLPVADQGLVLFMQAARWPDDIRIRDRQHHRRPWHYINLPFKPEGQPASVQIRESEPVNVLTALRMRASLERCGAGKRLLLRGSSILWATYTNPYTRLKYSLLSIQRVIEAGMKSVCG
jgi:hypothetical protein